MLLERDFGTPISCNGRQVELGRGVGASSEDRETYHWFVPPGHHVYRHTTEGSLRLPFDTRMHLASAHLHGFGESLELRDKTGNRSIALFDATNFEDRIGLAQITQFVSEEGVPIYRDHEYELLATYNNTTEHPVDAMAIVYYALDKDFDVTRAQAKP